MVKLREPERKILTALKDLGAKASVEQLVTATRLSDSAVMRAVLTLQDNEMVQTTEKKQTIAKLTEEGKTYAKSELPERRLITVLQELGGKAPLAEMVRKSSLEDHLMPIALGWVQRKKWATLDSKTGILQMQSKPAKGADEELLRLLDEKKTIIVEDLSLELQDAFRLLKGRKLLNVEGKTKREIEITESGRSAAKKEVKAIAEVTQITQELIVTGKWRKVNLQRYNIEAAVAKTWPGKKHPYLRFLDEVKERLINLGFKEMTGTNVETSFFNFDALYTPQDHPAREIMDIYFVKSPKHGKIGAEKQVLLNVKQTHENGWKTGSKGWQYKYSVQEAKRLILRGHGTCLSARTLLSKNLEIPGRYFSIARCYRPEVLDQTHLTEFNQVEGIVVDENLNLRDLLGILMTFATEIAGANRVKMKPDYYPFTEPSVELSAYKEGYGWIEFGGSGIFRPEVTLPLGIKAPVIAWGLGIDRLFMMKAKINDIRCLFSKDLHWLRTKEAI
ncbi:phenylalanine--tRNA ligase subunit alpha [Candidatus Bathyarchaeota archaeon]|nr:phenylalanine--tRNA ligase subunit alpha [Candidatus Bathyarchaeota archaeon]